jgi:hypothetical protein
LKRNGVVLQVDRALEDTAAARSAIDVALALGARRIERTQTVWFSTPSVCDATRSIAAFVPQPEHGDRLADEGQQLTQDIDLMSGAEVNYSGLRKRLSLYARAHGLVIRQGDPETRAREASSADNQQPGHRNRASPGYLRLDDTLKYLAERAGGGEYRGEPFASPSAVMTGMLKDFVPALQLTFADGGRIIHRDRTRWKIELEQRLVRNHWQTMCHNLPHFGFHLPQCLSCWPGALACSVEQHPPSREGKPPIIVVHGRVRNRLIKLFTNAVGVPVEHIRCTGKDPK